MLQPFLLSPLGWLHLFIQQFAQGSSAELQAPIYRKSPPKLAANLSLVTTVREKHFCCDISCTKHHRIDHLCSELLPFFLCPICSSRAARCTGWSLPGLTLNGDHLPVTRLGCFTALLLTECFLLSPLPTRSNRNEKMAAIVTHMAGGKWIRI